MVRELRRAGFEPDWRRVDTEADYLQALVPDLDIILSDYSMPQFDAPRALRLLQERGLDIPFIIVSGTVGEDDGRRGDEGRAPNDYLHQGPAELAWARRCGRPSSREGNASNGGASRPSSSDSSRPAPPSSTRWPCKDGELEHSWISDNVTRLDRPRRAGGVSGRRGGSRTSIRTTGSGCLLRTRRRTRSITCCWSIDSSARTEAGLWVRDEKRLLRDAGGHAGGSRGFLGGHHRAQAGGGGVAESEARLRLVMRRRRDGNCELELDDRQATSGLSTLFEMFGLDPERAEPQLEVWRGLVRPDDLERALSAMEIGRRGTLDGLLEHRIRAPTPDGITWLSVDGALVSDGRRRAPYASSDSCATSPNAGRPSGGRPCSMR